MLTQEQIDKVRLMFSTAGWSEVVQPMIENRFRHKTRMLIRHPSERGENALDDTAIRGALQELEWLLTWFQNEIEVYEHNRRVDELDPATLANGTEPIGSGSPANP